MKRRGGRLFRPPAAPFGLPWSTRPSTWWCRSGPAGCPPGPSRSPCTQIPTRDEVAVDRARHGSSRSKTQTRAPESWPTVPSLPCRIVTVAPRLRTQLVRHSVGQYRGAARAPHSPATRRPARRSMGVEDELTTATAPAHVLALSLELSHRRTCLTVFRREWATTTCVANGNHVNSPFLPVIANRSTRRPR